MSLRVLCFRQQVTDARIHRRQLNAQSFPCVQAYLKTPRVEKNLIKTPRPGMGTSNGSSVPPHGFLPQTRRYASPAVSERRDPLVPFPPAPSVGSSVMLTAPQHPLYAANSSSDCVMPFKQAYPRFPAGESVQLRVYGNLGGSLSRSATPTSRAQTPSLAAARSAGHPNDVLGMALNGESSRN